MKWEILDNSPIKNTEDLISILLKNRGLQSKKQINEFLNPEKPQDINFDKLGIDQKTVNLVVERIKLAKEKKEKIVIFGDYDADGVCATAILWECLYKLGFDAMPYIPDRFEEGYGLKAESLANEKLRNLNPNLIITVDNGIVAYEGIKEAKRLGIDVVVVDHHLKGVKKTNTQYVIHSTLVCGSALSWFLSKELGVMDGLDLVSLGTIADQMHLLDINRSLVKFGLVELKNTKRVGLKSLIKRSNLDKVGVYEVGFVIAPRINAMGRLASATDSLRFLCTRDPKKAEELNNLLDKTNVERQKIVDDVVVRTAREITEENKIIVISGDYHEGVIGLASGRITEKFYKPSIVISKGEKISKASARSINGFNIIEAIKSTGLIIEGGGHPMAAGFSIETEKIELFTETINKLSIDLLTEDILSKKLKIDAVINFKQISNKLIRDLEKFEPFGNSNFSPLFASKNIRIVEFKTVGSEGKHVKLKLEQSGIIFDAIAFGFSDIKSLNNEDLFEFAYSVEENTWNNRTSIQLKIKDVHPLGN